MLCKVCKDDEYLDKYHAYFGDSNYICEKCQINDLSKKYVGYKFKTTKNDGILFSKKCMCDKYTEWCDISYIDIQKNFTSDCMLHVIQCRECDPSSDLIKYKFGKHWTFERMGKKCLKCDNLVWTTSPYWSSIIQCEKCDPSTKYVKYKFDSSGWSPNQMKIFRKNRHVWVVAYINTEIDYKCTCTKCE